MVRCEFGRMMWTKQEIADKVDSEGGWASFMQWGGIGEDDVPIEIRSKWVEVIWAWKDFDDAVQRLQAELPEPNYD